MSAHELNPFDATPDALLGARLRAALDPDGGADTAAFATRVRLLLDPADQESGWDVLARWLRPGVAAAVLIAFALGAWLGRGRPEPVAASSSQPPEDVLASTTAPSGDLLLAAFVLEAK